MSPLCTRGQAHPCQHTKGKHREKARPTQVKKVYGTTKAARQPMGLTLNTYRAMETTEGSSKNQGPGRWLDGERTIESLSLDPHHSGKMPVMDR